MCVKISGNNYVSKQTQKAYYEALNDGIRIESAKNNPQEKIVEKIVEKVVEVPVYIDKNTNGDVSQPSQINNTNQLDHSQSDDLNTEEMKKEQINMLKDTISLVTAQQDKNMEMMQQLMEQQFQQSNQLIKLLNNAFSSPEELCI